MLRLAVVFCTVVMPARAQTATVFYDHSFNPSLTTANERIAFREPGQNGGDFRSGPVERLVSAKGKDRACFAILNANPMLYTYSAKGKVVEVTTPDDFKPFIEGLAQIVVKGGAAGAGPPPPVEAYRDSLLKLARGADSMATVRLASDRDNKVAAAATLMLDIHEAREGAIKFADSLFEANKTDKEMKLLRAAHLSISKELESLRKEAEAASALDDASPNAKPMRRCVDVDKNRLAVGLHIVPKLEIPGGAKRPVGDSVAVATFEVDPGHDDRIAVAPGAFMNPFTYQARSYGLNGGSVVESKADGDFRVRTGLFLMARRNSSDRWWGTVGVAKGDGSKPDLFLGVVNRFGESAVQPGLALGIGFAAMQVPVGLDEGATVGQPLPANVEKLESVIKREYRGGLGVFFMLTGLSLPGSDGDSK